MKAKPNSFIFAQKRSAGTLAAWLAKAKHSVLALKEKMQLVHTGNQQRTLASGSLCCNDT
jgi:hypothetical protein